MPIQPVTKRYYPALSEVITVDDLPEFLHFAETGLNALLDKIHYKNFQYSKSARGDSAFYSLDIVTKNIGFNLPFGLRFVLNPDLDGDSTISSFPISLQYQWEVLAFLRSFNIQNFAFTPAAFFELGLKIFRVSEDQVLAQTLNYFIEADTTNDKFQDLLDAINELYPAANLQLPVGEEPTVEIVAGLITASSAIPASISEVMFASYILDTDLSVTMEKLEQFYRLMVPDGIENYIKQLLKPKLRATLEVSAGIEFPANILQPVTEAGVPIPDTKTIFKFAKATFYADTEAGIGTEVAFEGSLTPTYSQIGNTGLILQFEKAKLDLSRKTNIPEADAAGYPVDFMGIYIKEVSVRFNKFGTDDPDHVSASLNAENLFIGTGGVSGKITLAADNFIYRKFGSFKAELNLFALEFKLGSIVSCDIRGKLSIEKFKQNGNPAVLDISAHIGDNGDFNITALNDSFIPPFRLFDVLEIKITSISMGSIDDRFYIEVTGQLDFIVDIPVLGDVLPKGIEVRKLRIWDNGELEFKGGGLVVPKAFTLEVGPVKLEVTNIGFGSYHRQLNDIERSYSYFTFDGMLNTGMAGINTTGNGIKFYYTTDHNNSDKPFDCFLSIDKLNIDMTIPGNVDKDKAAFTLNGYLSMSNPDPEISGSNAGSEYSGAVSFTMPRLKIGGSAGMRLNPNVPAFVVDIGLEVSTPIPLGATGLGIYGFRGLIGQHYLPSKSATTPPLPESASWWQYYKAKSTRTGQEGIEIDKFADQPGYSVGAGISIATAFDSGKIFSSKLFLLLGMPDVFLIQGQAGILRSRIGLNDDVDPPFSAFIAIDNSSVRANLGVNYRLPEGGSFDGALFSLSGALDMAFFFNNASGWYLNVGKDQPESERIRTRILTLFQGYAYLMISSRGFKAGAGASFDFNKKFGPVAVGFGAFLDLGGSLSFKPIQIGAFIVMGGYAYLKVFFIKLGLSIQIGLAVEAPHPFNLLGSLEIKLKLPWPIKDIKLRIEVSWRINNDNTPLLAPQPILQLPDPNVGYLPVAATNILSSDVFTVNYVTNELIGDNIVIPAPGDAAWQYNFNDAQAAKLVTIPLDSFIDIELLKPVKPSLQKLGGAGNQLPDGYTEYMPPQKGLSNQVRHEFELTGLDVFVWDQTAGSWKPYQIYEAVTAIVAENTGPEAIDLSALKVGYWQFTTPDRYNKIRLLSQNMFSYANQTTSASGDLDALNFKRKDVFCFENVTKQGIVNWADVPLDTSYPTNTTFVNKGFQFSLEQIEGIVSYDANFGKNSLFLTSLGGKITLILPQPLSYVQLDFGANKNDIRIDFIEKQYFTGPYGQALPYDNYIESAELNKTQSDAVVTYSDVDHAIDRIEINLLKDKSLDFDGNLMIGGYFQLPDEFAISPDLPFGHEEELDKALMFVTLFNTAFTPQQVLDSTYTNVGDHIVGQWQLRGNATDSAGTATGMVMGSPDVVTGFYERDGINQLQKHSIFNFSGNNDALVVPYQPQLKVETGSFAVALTAVFSPFTAGISTLFAKVNVDPITGYKKGFTIHLCQDTPAEIGLSYNVNTLPSFSIYFTCYADHTYATFKATEKYTAACATGAAVEKQYKFILVSVDRTNGTLSIFIDRILKATAIIPAELSFYSPTPKLTVINQLSYLTEVLQRRQEENEVTKEKLIEEIQLIGDSLNKTIQPVWRPNTTFAVTITTRDVVNGNYGAVNHTQVFGFKTAGPIGHFQQQSAVYQQLADQDRAAEFKLANLKHYIDYERSFPDAQSRYDLSKPVFYADPQIRLLFIKPYINAMFVNWDSYQGLPEVLSSLELELIDPFGQTMSPQLIWEQLPDKTIDINNFQALPQDQQILFLMNLAASMDGCNESPLVVKKRTKQGSYHLPDLDPNRLYTAVFNAKYQPDDNIQLAEVHRFSFLTSRFSSFIAQAKSFVLNDTPGEEQFAIYPIKVGFTAAEINNNIKILLDDDPDNDPAAVLRFAVKYDRLIFGGLLLKNLDALTQTVINYIINVDPESNEQQILGLLVRNPEPFNDPKLPINLLQDTIGLELRQDNEVVLGIDQFMYVHARDTSAVFITNAAMEITNGMGKLNFRYKKFNGNDYQTEHDDYSSPEFPINMEG